MVADLQTEARMFVAYIEPLVVQHGYWAVFVIVMMESAGVPLPGETALVLAAVFAGATGQLDIAWVIALAAAGAIIGDNIGFWFGRTYGLPFLQRYGQFIHLSENRLKLGQHLFARHGAKVVFFGRFVAVLRIFAALLAGVNRYGWGQFLFYNAAGGIIWATSFGLAGYFFGDAFNRVAGPLGVAALGAAIIGFLGAWWFARRHEQQMEAEASRSDKDDSA